jgi:hypothetical protein
VCVLVLNSNWYLTGVFFLQKGTLEELKEKIANFEKDVTGQEENLQIVCCTDWLPAPAT